MVSLVSSKMQQNVAKIIENSADVNVSDSHTDYWLSGIENGERGREPGGDSDDFQFERKEAGSWSQKAPSTLDHNPDDHKPCGADVHHYSFSHRLKQILIWLAFKVLKI